MKAILCEAFGSYESLVYRDAPDPTPGPDEVVIRAEAAGVNFPDVLLVAGKYQLKPSLPFSPGLEVAGTIAAVGANVTKHAVGDRVVAMTPCGSFAELVVAHASMTVKLLDGVAFDVAAASLVAYGTTYHALVDRGALRAGESLLVLGAAGGVGLAAVEVGALLGARVIAAASTHDKRELTRQYGANETIDYTAPDFRDALKKLVPAGIDVTYDAVGGPTSELAVRSTAWNGRFLVVGFASGEIPKLPLNLALLKSCSIVGVAYGETFKRSPDGQAAHLRTVMQHIVDGKLRPRIDAHYPLADTVRALDDVAKRKVKGKIVVTM